MADESRGWQIGRSPLDCHKYMFENEVACDVTFLFPQEDGSSISVLAHSYMLRCRSPVFEAMLAGNFKEKMDGIMIADLEPEVFKEVLKYMYCDDIALTSHNVLHVLFAAKKYLLDCLTSRCQTFLQEEMTTENACTILNHSMRYDEVNLTEQCVEFIKLHASEVVKSDDFLGLSQDSLHKLVSDDQFNLISEEEIFLACCKWAKGQKQDSSLRDILGKCLYQIRFSGMDAETILKLNLQVSGLLSDSEVLSFLNLSVCKVPIIPEIVRAFNFKKRLRISLTTTCTTPNRFKGRCDEYGWHVYQSTPDKIDFTVNKPAIFHGVTLFGGRKVGEEYKTVMKLLKDGNVVNETTGNFTSDGTNKPIQFKTNEPCPLEPNVVYHLEVGSNGPQTYNGDGGVHSVTEAGVTFTFKGVTSSNNNGTSIISGQIPQILFSVY